MNRHLARISGFGAILALTTGAALAAEREQLRRDGNNILPGTEISSSAPTVIDGLYEVVAGENVLYVDDSGRYLVIGSIYDLHEDRDLSAERRAEVRRSYVMPDLSHLVDQLNQVPDDAVVTTGTGGHRLTVIMDPHCGWCRRLWTESLSDLEGVAVRHLFAIPSDEAVGILCSRDPDLALRRALEIKATTTKTPIPAAHCRREASDAIVRVAALLESAGLSGTPILIREDGDIHMGYMRRVALLNWLEGSRDDAR